MNETIKKGLTETLRIFLAVVFIASGFVKAVDPVGFSFKLEEYFSPSVFNLEFLSSYALVFAVFVVMLELLFGLALLFKLEYQKVLLALIVLCIFFGFLTFYSAYFNVVTDCGCFGDALKLTPWQSFIKDLVLLVGLVILWFRQSNFKSPTFPSRRAGIWGVGILMLIASYFIYMGIYSEPLIDFRSYKIGTDLVVERNKLNQNPSQYKTVYTLLNPTTNETKEVDQDEYVATKALWEEGTPWVIQDELTRTELVKQGYQSEISKFKIEADGMDITEDILSASHVVLLFSYDPKSLTTEQIAQAERKVRANPLVFGVSTASNTFSKIKNATMDGTAIKTIARSNPFVMVLQKGKIIRKVPVYEYQ